MAQVVRRRLAVCIRAVSLGRVVAQAIVCARGDFVANDDGGPQGTGMSTSGSSDPFGGSM